ncbi:helix-turn-helix transcriptional regulator [Arabiibacter massiliensis]|uniref:helix-turn-helix transcriptional regulator n=1 Tax=Arabiibacter massiliensis TaxID=1870985 RepID=UPI00117A3096|nr:helix-turn-helix transcriptional regulator [Arabiibacter massiliensis]
MEVKLPRLKVEVREDEGFSLGKLSLPLIAGFGSHWAWVYLTMFNGQQLFFWNAADPAATATLFHPASLVFFVTTLFSYGVLSRAFRRLFATQRRRKSIRFLGASLACAGTLLMCLAGVESAAGIAALVAGGAATGVGSAILLMSYGVSFGQCDIATIVTSTALSLVAGIALYALVSNLDALHPLGAVAAALIPFLECWCLYRCSTVLIDKLEFAAITLKVRKAPFALRLCAPSLLFGFALGNVRVQAIADMHLVGGLGTQIACIGAAALVACALMIAVMLTQRQHLNFMFRTLLPLIAVALVAVHFVADATPFTTFALLLCYLLFEGAMWVSYADITQRFRLTAFVVFGFGRGALALGALLGIAASAAIPQLDPAVDPASTLVVVLACVVGGFGALPRGSEIRALVVGESDNPAGEQDASRERAAEEASPEKARAGRFKRKCELVANRYLLSKKETEVLFLLAKGRNAAYIQEQLYISEGTARTHMRHIYKKMDIHTQQELIDLVEDAEE